MKQSTQRLYLIRETKYILDRKDSSSLFIDSTSLEFRRKLNHDWQSETFKHSPGLEKAVAAKSIEIVEEVSLKLEFFEKQVHSQQKVALLFKNEE